MAFSQVIFYAGSDHGDGAAFHNQTPAPAYSAERLPFVNNLRSLWFARLIAPPFGRRAPLVPAKPINEILVTAEAAKRGDAADLQPGIGNRHCEALGVY